MGDDLKRSVLLRHMEQAGNAIFNKKAKGEEKEGSETQGEDSLGELPDLDRLKSSRLHRGLNTSRQEQNEEEVEAGVPSWREFFSEEDRFELVDRNFIYNVYYSLPKSTEARSIPIFIFHHGAGSSALSFANLSKNLYAKLDGKCACFAFDARGHGKTTRIDSNVTAKYDRDTFVADFKAIIEHICDKMLVRVPESKRSVILIGHSLGGCICTFTYSQLSPEVKKQVLGVCMLDIVEEAAIQALGKVQNFVHSTINSFGSYNEAIEWHISSNLSRNRESASIAIPALFRRIRNGKVVRITDLKSFQGYWDTWFTRLSKSFVELPTCKLLILAGNDNLDKELMIGQMQGKYQLCVFQDSGHFIQEDTPTKTAVVLIEFWRRNDNKLVVIKSNWGTHG